MKSLDNDKYTVYSDLPGYTVGAGSIPPELCITVEKPDIVIQDKINKFIHLFELSVNLVLSLQNLSRIFLHWQFTPLSTFSLQEKKKCSQNLPTFSHLLMTSEYI